MPTPADVFPRGGRHAATSPTAEHVAGLAAQLTDAWNDLNSKDAARVQRGVRLVAFTQNSLKNLAAAMPR